MVSEGIHIHQSEFNRSSNRLHSCRRVARPNARHTGDSDMDVAKHGGRFRPLQPSHNQFMLLLPFPLKTERSSVFVHHDPKTALFFLREKHGDDHGDDLRVTRLPFFEFEHDRMGSIKVHLHAVALPILGRIRQAMARWKAQITNFSAM